MSCSSLIASHFRMSHGIASLFRPVASLAALEQHEHSSVVCPPTRDCHENRCRDMTRSSPTRLDVTTKSESCPLSYMVLAANPTTCERRTIPISEHTSTPQNTSTTSSTALIFTKVSARFVVVQQLRMATSSSVGHTIKRGKACICAWRLNQAWEGMSLGMAT
jgi:hypothetical protein